MIPFFMVRVVRAIVEIAVCVCLLPIYFRFYLVGASALDSKNGNWLLDSYYYYFIIIVSLAANFT